MASISDLPNEILLQLTSYLNFERLLALATVNKHLHLLITSLPSTQLQIVRRRNERHVLSLFTGHCANSNSTALSSWTVDVKWSGFAAFGLNGPMESRIGFYRRKYLAWAPVLDGSFDWLRQYDATFHGDDEFRVWSNIKTPDLVHFHATTEKLGFRVPSVVTKFLQSDLDTCVHTAGLWYFELGKRVLKVNLRKPQHSRGRKGKHEYGYLIDFLRQEGGDRSKCFYFDRQGGFGIVGKTSQEHGYPGEEGPSTPFIDALRKPPRLDKADKEASVVAIGIDATSDIALEGVDFEKWLFRWVDDEARKIEDEQG
jgi:hypothetical protein